MTQIREFLSKHFPNNAIADHNGIPVLHLSDSEQATAAVSLAIDYGLKLCPAGSMSHTSLSDYPDNWIILSSDRMVRKLVFVPDDLYVTVESGMRLDQVNALIANRGLMFPFGDCGYTGTTGGAIALGLTARRDDELFEIKRWVISLSFVMPYGKHVTVGAVTLKSVAGYDVTKLLVGSRGTLGFITSVTLRLVHKSQESLFTGMILDEPGIINPNWDETSQECSTVERNLKSNLDPHSIFPSLLW
jgi:glycolate oxidase FAD binding subunit